MTFRPTLANAMIAYVRHYHFRVKQKTAWSKTSNHVNVRPSSRSQLHDEPPILRACPVFLAGDETPTTSGEDPVIITVITGLTEIREMLRDTHVLNGCRRVETRCNARMHPWEWSIDVAYSLGTLEKESQAQRIRQQSRRISGVLV